MLEFLTAEIVVPRWFVGLFLVWGVVLLVQTLRALHRKSKEFPR